MPTYPVTSQHMDYDPMSDFSPWDISYSCSNSLKQLDVFSVLKDKLRVTLCTHTEGSQEQATEYRPCSLSSSADTESAELLTLPMHDAAVCCTGKSNKHFKLC